MFLVKLMYEKYFSGIERIEPLKEREDLRRLVRDLIKEYIPNTAQRHKFTSLKARFNSLEMYWQRNLVQLERGTHPKMKFRLAIQEQQRRDAAAKRNERAKKRQLLNERQREELAYRTVFDKFIDARSQCGQSAELSYDAVKDSLKKQARMIKSKFKVEKVKFRVAIEDGKAKMKAIPIKQDEK